MDSGKTKEYHARNSPNASRANPVATKRVPFLFPSIYETIVSIAPYTNKINEIDLITCSREMIEINKGNIPTDLKYLDLGKNDFMVCENAMKKYPTVCTAIPNVWTHLSILPALITNDSTIYPVHMIKKPILIEKNAIVNLNKVGLPVFLNPTYDIIPIRRPTKNPIKFRMFSSRNSNYAQNII